MRVAFIIDHLRPDGTQRVLAQLAEGLARRGHMIGVLCMNDSVDGPLRALLGRAGAEVRVIGRAGIVGGIGLLWAWLWLRQRRFDVAVTLLFASDVLGRPLAAAAGVPRIVSSVRARNVNYTGWQRRLVRLTMPLAGAVVINSLGARDFVIAEEGADRQRVRYIPNGVELERYQTPLDRAALRAELGLPGDAPLIGSVGRLTRQKGFDLLISALADQRLAGAHLLLVGVGEEEPRLRAQAVGLGLAGRLHLAGYRRDVPRLLGALDIYAHPARFEGMPNALLEAMAAGCPIVATEVDGSRELICDGEHGWLVAPERPAAMAEALAAALADRAGAARRGARARQRAQAAFSLEAMMAAWEEVLGG